MLQKKVINYFAKKKFSVLKGAFFTLPEKSFSVFNRAPSDTLKVVVNNIIFFFCQHPWKVRFELIHDFFSSKYINVVKKYNLVFVNYFKICISKSFMRPNVFCSYLKYFFISPFSPAFKDFFMVFKVTTENKK